MVDLWYQTISFYLKHIDETILVRTVGYPRTSSIKHFTTKIKASIMYPCFGQGKTLSLKWIQLNCGLYYKPVTIVNDDSRVINKFETSHTDDARVIIYDCHMFIVQATGHIIGYISFVS